MLSNSVLILTRSAIFKEMLEKKAVVTGVSRGIGLAICRQLVSEQFKVYGTYNTGTNEAKLLKQELGDRVELYQVDFADRIQTLSFIDKMKKFTFHTLINNAGIIEFENFQEFDLEIWDRTIEVNLTATLLLSQGLQSAICDGGSIVNITSTDAMTGSFASISYAVSKAAQDNLTKSLSNNLGSRNIRVNAIAPGWIDTSMSTQASMAAVALTPLARNGRSAEIAKVTSFLISDAASFITGATIIVDGGYTNVDYILLKESQGEQ
jgi:NAD(P)-dependent dehydrogenase (short-subunit alcohol dehydrogenase family)